MVDQELVRIIRDQFALAWTGIHGAPHWSRVRENGLRLAGLTGVKPEVVELFAFLHDSRRLNDGPAARAARISPATALREE